MIHRIDVGIKGGVDPLGESVRHQIAEFGPDPGPVRMLRIFLIDTDADESQIRRIAHELLADPIVDEARIVQAPDPARRTVAANASNRIEIHLKPGVMDPVAASTEMAIRDMGIDVKQVRTGRAYVFEKPIARQELERIAWRILANGVIESVHFEPFIPERFPAGHEYRLQLRHVPLLKLSDDELKKLSREGHLFLSLAEMKAIQSYFRERGREPTDIELETLAQTWSEHCVHKTLKSAVEVIDERGNVLRRYSNLIRDTIFASTMELMHRRVTGEPFCLSVFKDNAGVIAFDQTDAVCFKVETHNHPSAIEPYGGSATGIGGVIRDILGTGLGARPVANTDVFCVADPKYPADKLPRGVIHPRRILQQVVAGVRDYGNRMGIPTVNGAVYFHDDYIGNPLVFCGCVGIIPRDRIHKEARPGDAIVVMGGRTGRDGIHGATFSSAELTDTHADEFSHAVQIGNAITEKKMADVILQGRDRNLFNAITDCGAGGLSSAVGEMGQKIGAFVELHKVPLKYAGLRYDEIWISEAQERMVLAVPEQKVDELLELSRGEDVEATVIGHFGTEDAELILHYDGVEVGRLSMQFLHNGIPMPTRRAVLPSRVPAVSPAPAAGSGRGGSDALRDRLLSLLAHPNIASKHWIIRQYDHEVQGGTVIKPLTGPLQVGPSDAAVIRPKLTSSKGVVIACGLAPHIQDPYEMSIAAIDEAIRNAVAVGADPSQLAILDNFCWPSVDDELTMGTLVAACEACRDAALAYGVPFISGKDSLHNQFTNQETGQVIRIPRTLLISGIGVIENVCRCVTLDLKDPRDGRLCMIRPRDPQAARFPVGVHRAVAEAIARRLVLSCHDVSDGGWLVAAAEMCIASGLGLRLNSAPADELFAEGNGRYLVEVNPTGIQALRELAAAHGAALVELGSVREQPVLEMSPSAPDRPSQVDLHVSVDELSKAWRGTLDW
ncbi:phosphoribosylformylglycinamidine synthase subunit PurS [Fontivita pretiosa]|uniref:phosphoribosylformylglycinamidine synthase subunit PurS n=1 Tax=Fontivita pretiosa TaxID=2989684 RepID=UPI003D16A386